MKITKLEHSGIAFEKSGEILLCDPVEIQDKLPDFDNVVAIIITHKHGDHFQPHVLEKIRSQNPNAQIFTATDNTTNIPDAQAIQSGDELQVGSFSLKFFSKNHAPIITGQIPCENLGIIIDNEIVNPGDSFDLPNLPSSPKVLFVALAAPWCKTEEVLNYITAVKPQIVIPVHDAILSDFGKQINNNWLRSFCDQSDIDFYPLSPNEHLETSRG